LNALALLLTSFIYNPYLSLQRNFTLTARLSERKNRVFVIAGCILIKWKRIDNSWNTGG